MYDPLSDVKQADDEMTAARLCVLYEARRWRTSGDPLLLHAALEREDDAFKAHAKAWDAWMKYLAND